MVRAEETLRAWKAYTPESTHTELSGVFEQRTLTGSGRFALFIFIFNQGNANSVYANPVMERPAVDQIHGMTCTQRSAGFPRLPKSLKTLGEMSNYNETFT